MRIVVRDRQVRPTLPPELLGRVAAVVCARLELDPGSAGLAWVDDGQMRELHGRFRDAPQTTDVLSFPVDGEAAEEEGGDEPCYWGDVVVCTDAALRQSREYGHPYPFELLVLVLHGLLHLRGFDHTVDDGEMTALEQALRPRALAGVTAWS